MSNLRFSKGMGLVEVMIAMFLTTVAIMAIFSLQAPAFRTAGKADYLGRAAEILERQLESTEVYVMNVCNLNASVNEVAITTIPAIPAAVGAITNALYDVRTSGLVADITGDATYHVNTTITAMPLVPPSVLPTYFRVNVTVTWGPITFPYSITQTIFVSRQVFFLFGACS